MQNFQLLDFNIYKKLPNNENLIYNLSSLKQLNVAVPKSLLDPVAGSKGLQRQRLIGSAVAGFNHGKTITKASATDLH